jgi:quercetin dioxygenase-like cupin family protein
MVAMSRDHGGPAVLKLDLAAIAGVKVSRFGSQAATHTRIADMGPRSAVGVIHLGPRGRLGRHAATVPQLMMVASGYGYTRGQQAELQRIGPGDAVLWTRGEEHETWTDAGMTLVIIETDDPNLGVAHG